MNRKSELLTRKYADITNDFIRMFKDEGKRPGVIYDELSNKYYLDQGTIFRIVYSQTKFQRESSHSGEVP
jgi:hypothetical protein